MCYGYCLLEFINKTWHYVSTVKLSQPFWVHNNVSTHDGNKKNPAKSVLLKTDDDTLVVE